MPPLAAGLAHVATVSFLASRAAPSAQFWIALAGGAAVARASAEHGLRTGIGTSAAATLQTVAVMGPARLNAPLTQALSAPVVGRMHARGAGAVAQFGATFAIRLAHYAVLLAAFIWIILGGLDAFAGSYDALTGWLPFAPEGVGGALLVVGAGQVLWAVGFSVVQVALYRRALDAWPRRTDGDDGPGAVAAPEEPPGPRPRLLAAIAVAATAALLAVPAWPVLLAVAAALPIAWAATRAELWPLRLGAALAALLAFGAAAGSLLADLGADEAARRALRAGELVLVATWLRAAARPAGLRQVFTDGLRVLRRAPGAPEARALLATLDPGPRLIGTGRSLPDRLAGVRKRPGPVADAVIVWVAAESAAYRA